MLVRHGLQPIVSGQNRHAAFLAREAVDEPGDWSIAVDAADEVQAAQVDGETHQAEEHRHQQDHQLE